jgi:NitT/TauT family transport system substrate-binding protein
MKRFVGFAVAAALGFAIALPVQAADKITVALNWNVPYSGWAGFYVARAKGYYAAEGLDIEWTLIKGSNPVNQTIAAGNAQLGVAAASSVVVAASKGLPLIAVSAFMQSNPEGVIVREDSGIKEMKDFVGKRIAINPANPTSYLFEAKLARAGIDKNKIDFLNVQPEAMVPLIIKGEVKGGLGYWDWQAINIRKEGVPVNVFVMSDDKVQIYGNVVVANRDWAAKNGDVIKRFLKASVRGWIDAFDNVELAHAEMMKANKEEDPNFLRQALAVSMKLIGSPDATSNGFGWMEKANWEALQDALLKGKVIDKPVDMSSLYTNAYLPPNAKDWGKRQ